MFEDAIHDAIWSQTNTLITPNITRVENVGRVRVRGLELTVDYDAVAGINGLAIQANLAFNRSKILQNSFAASVGKQWPRLPKIRANLSASYALNPQWRLSGSLSHAGRQYNELDNSDSNSATFGASSRLTSADIRAQFTPNKTLELALGISNLANNKAWQFHPYPQRTVLMEARLSY